MNDGFGIAGLSALDRHFGRFIGAFSNPPDPLVVLAAALVSRAAARGDVCLELATAGDLEPGMAPDPESWTAALKRSPAIGRPGQKRPLILDEHGRLYLCRYWDYEDRLARDFCERAEREAALDPLQLDSLVQAVFERLPGRPDADQRAAAAAAGRRGVTVITGGPGSGKTYTITAILDLLRRLQEGRPLRALLTAPTGKAAARLQESLRRVGLPGGATRRRRSPRSTACCNPSPAPPGSGTIAPGRLPRTRWWSTKPPWWTWRSWPSWPTPSRRRPA